MASTVILVDESFNVVGESKGCVEGLALLACSQRVRIVGGGGRRFFCRNVQQEWWKVEFARMEVAFVMMLVL